MECWRQQHSEGLFWMKTHKICFWILFLHNHMIWRTVRCWIWSVSGLSDMLRNVTQSLLLFTRPLLQKRNISIRQPFSSKFDWGTNLASHILWRNVAKEHESPDRYCVSAHFCPWKLLMCMIWNSFTITIDEGTHWWDGSWRVWRFPNLRNVKSFYSYISKLLRWVHVIIPMQKQKVEHSNSGRNQMMQFLLVYAAHGCACLVWTLGPKSVKNYAVGHRESSGAPTGWGREVPRLVRVGSQDPATVTLYHRSAVVGAVRGAARCLHARGQRDNLLGVRGNDGSALQTVHVRAQRRHLLLQVEQQFYAAFFLRVHDPVVKTCHVGSQRPVRQVPEPVGARLKSRNKRLLF